MTGDLPPRFVDSAVIAHPADWQWPYGIEEAAYEVVRSIKIPDNNESYVAFPWATLIDALHSGRMNPELLLIVLAGIKEVLAKRSGRVFTVSQSPFIAKFIDVIAAAGITDIFWPHKQLGVDEIGDVKLHPFPLYPVQVPEFFVRTETEIKYLANFFGGYKAGAYLSDTRQHLFDRRRTEEDLRIVQRGPWHFERLVLNEQMEGKRPEDSVIETEIAHKKQYLNAILASTFTFCPTGPGLATSRIYEALALGSIPVILTLELDLCGDPSLWAQACVFASDSKQGLEASIERIRSMSSTEIKEKQAAIRLLYLKVGPSGYRQLLIKNFESLRKP